MIISEHSESPAPSVFVAQPTVAANISAETIAPNTNSAESLAPSPDAPERTEHAQIIALSNDRTTEAQNIIATVYQPGEVPNIFLKLQSVPTSYASHYTYSQIKRTMPARALISTVAG